MIDIYETSTAFLFRQRDKLLCTLTYCTLEADYVKGVSAEDVREIEYHIGEFVPGEVHKFHGREVVLGAPRDFTHEVTLDAVGNPDMGQYARIGPKKTVRCIGTDEAVEAVKAYQERYEMGGGNCSREHGTVWELPAKPGGKRKKVGDVNYGGRYWTVAQRKAWELEMAAKYPKTA